MEDAFALFKSDMESRDLEIIVDAANKLTIVAASIGKARILSDLIPYFQSLMAVPSDEVLVAIGRQLYNVWDLAGGSKSIGDEGTALFFAFLRQLATEEEVIVRQSAITALSQITPTLSQPHVTQYVISLFRSLVGHELFGARHTAAYLLPYLFRYAAPSHRAEIKQALISLSMDETPMVRRVIAQIIPAFCSSVTDLTSQEGYPAQLEGYELLKHTVIPIIQQLSLDERDYLRDLAPQCVTGLIPSLPLEVYEVYIYPIIKGLSEDLSWKVRQHLCEQCPLFVANLLKRATYQYQKEAGLIHKKTDDQDKYKKSLTETGGKFDINHYFSQIFDIHASLLLHDPNLEVRAVGILNMVDMMYLAKGVVVSDLFEKGPRDPIFSAKTVEQDSLTLTLEFPQAPPPHRKKPFVKPAPSNTVFTIDHQKYFTTIGVGFGVLSREIGVLSKVDLAEAFASCAPFVGSEYIQQYILKVVNYLCLDEHVHVRSTMILSLEPFFATLPNEIVSGQIWPVIEALATDPRWRVRRAVTTQLAPLCFHLKKDHEFVYGTVLPVIEQLLSENVHAVRNRAAIEFRSILHTVGFDAVGKRFLPLCHSLYRADGSYMMRMTILHFLYSCATAYDQSCPKHFVAENFTPYFMEALKDPVCNVRSQAVRYVREMAKNEDLKGMWSKELLRNHFLAAFQYLSNDPHCADREMQLQAQEAAKEMEAHLAALE